MEKAVLVPSLKMLYNLQKHLKEEKAPLFKDVDRVYFGSEFCPLRLPTIEDISKAIDVIKEYGKAFTFVFPYIPEKYLRQAVSVLDFLSEKVGNIEVVVGDWGLLNLVSREYSFKIVLGRVLSKQRNGPRIHYLKGIDEGTYTSSKRCHWDVDSFVEEMKGLRVCRFEMDYPIQGISEDFLMNLSQKISLSVYYPYVYVSTTLRCPVRDVLGCVCEQVYHKLSSKNFPTPLYNRGNTVFYKMEGVNIREIPWFDRCVYEVGVP